MLLPPDSLHVAFAQIKKAAKSHPEDPSFVSTLILSSKEVDSVCATKLICDALKQENVMFSLQAVSGFDEVDRLLPSALRDGTFLSIILINCGGSVDLTERFGELLEGVYLYMIDSHRPLHHKNLYPSASRVLVFGGEIEEIDEDFPTEDDPADDLVGEDEDEVDQRDFEENVQQNEEELGDLPSEENDDSQGEAGALTSPKKSTIQTKQQLALEKQERKRLVSRYYMYTSLGQPAAHVVYTLLEQVGRVSKSSSWMAIVGITSRYIAMEIDDEDYLDLILDKYREIVLDQNSSVKRFRQSLDDNQTNIPTLAREQIDFHEEEIRLALYRHWSLLDAFFNTEIFAARFGSWSVETSGEQERFLAKLGLSLRDASQKYGFMSKESKDKVRYEMRAIAEQEPFTFKRMTFPSFCFRTGFDKEILAEDAVRFIAALLDDAEHGDRHATSGSEFQATQSQGFNLALELLSKHQPELVNRALALAMKHKRILTAETMAVIQGNLVQNAGVFRYAVIELHENDDDREGHGNARALFFSCAANVVALAKHIINANQGRLRWLGDSARPLILAVVRKGSALVAAVPCPDKVGNVAKNPYGKFFRIAAHEISLDVDPYQFLNSFVIELNAEDVQQRFLLSLAKVASGEF